MITHTTINMGQKINFPSKDNSEFIAELRQRVTEYFEKNNISSGGNMNLYLKSVFMLSLYILPYILMITGIISSFAGVLFCWILIGVGKAGVGMGVMHDANHRSYSKNQKVNKWMSKTMFLVGGFPPNWQYQHNTMHHGFTNIDGHDEDIDPGPVMRLSPHKPRLKLHKFQHIYAWFLYGLMTLSWIVAKDFGQLNRYRKEGANLSSKKSYSKLFLELSIAKAVYFSFFIVLPILILPFAWYWTLIFFFLMHFVTGFILTTVFQTAHVVPMAEFPLPVENGSMENNWAIHQLKTTSDFAPGNKLITWLVGGLNYQVEHHLFPNISHVHYPKISKFVKETAKKYKVPYNVQPGFFRAVREHARMLKQLGAA